MKRIMVIGGAGFIGSHLCDALLEKGYFVLCIDNLMRGKLSNINHLTDNNNFSFVKADAGNIDLMSYLMNMHKIEHVYHLAANSDIQASTKDPQIEYNNTMKTTWSILSAMKINNIKNLFFASTSAVYGQQCDIALSEDTTLLQPISYYGAAKMASEAFIHAFTNMNDMNVLIFRFPNVIGPRLTHGVIFDFIERLKEDPSHLDVLGNGTQSKPYMHVFDLIKGILLLSESTKGVEIYNIGVNSETNVKRIAEIVINEMGLTGIPINYGIDNIGWKGDVPRFTYNLKKIHKTGWLPKMTSDEAIISTIKEVLLCKQ